VAWFGADFGKILIISTEIVGRSAMGRVNFPQVAKNATADAPEFW
jgi:hypothetical protein